jgi:ComF family protein
MLNPASASATTAELRTPHGGFRPDKALAGALERWRTRAGGRCAACRAWCGGGVCRFCAARFAPSWPRCNACAIRLPPTSPDWPEGQPGDARCDGCRRTAPPWSRAVAGVDYGHPWDRLLAEFKFHGRIEHAAALLQPLRARLGEGAPACLASSLRLVPVPLARERLRERGFNQSWELARRLGRALGVPARADALFRLRDTGHQLQLDREARQANLHDAFVVSPRHAAWVRGACVALVDDVLTTGATARAATRALQAAGAADVQVWVIARTPDA